jgi:hypothetical protein
MPKVDLRPFSIEQSRGCLWDFSDYCSYMAGCTGVKIKDFLGHDRVWVAEEDDRFVKICVVTYLGPGGGMTIDPKTLVEQEWETQDGSLNYRKNLMVISKVSMRGLYQSQAETFPISDVGRLVSHFSREYKRAKIEASAQELVSSGSEKDSAMRASERKWVGLLTLKAEMTKADFEKMIAEMKEVGVFSWSIDVSKNKGGTFTPELKNAARSKGEVRFTPVTGKGSGILTFLKNHSPFRAKVKGQDIDGIERVYYLQRKYEVLDSFQEVDWRRRWESKSVRDFTSTKAIATMIATMERDPRRFLQRGI